MLTISWLIKIKRDKPFINKIFPNKPAVDTCSAAPDNMFKAGVGRKPLNAASVKAKRSVMAA